MKGKTNANPIFQQIFFTVVCLTLLSGITSLSMTFQAKLSPEQTRIFETCNTTWNMGVGAIFGLLGSKTTESFRPNQNGKTKNDQD